VPLRFVWGLRSPSAAYGAAMIVAEAMLIDGERTSSVLVIDMDFDDDIYVAEGFEEATGWHLEDRGFCRGDVCVPVRDRADLEIEGAISLRAFADALRRPLVIEDGYPRVAVLGESRDVIDEVVGEQRAPEFTLPDVHGNDVSLDDFDGKKRVISTWASWCGCRWEIPSWQALQDELGDDVVVISVALDEDPDAVRHWALEDPAEPVRLPVLVDRNHVIAERYGVINVPSTVWIDEGGTIVRPPAIAPGDDQFREFTNIDSEVHHDELRRWVRDGELPAQPAEVAKRQIDPSDDLQRARAERRLAMHLFRTGREDAAARHLQAAIDLAPNDWTIVRGSMPVRGLDPFGAEFFEFVEQWEAAGAPSYPV
jgi:peroxiredoxin